MLDSCIRPVVACEVAVVAPSDAGAAPQRSAPDFLVGAHALLPCTGLITRGENFLRDYLKGLRVIVPQSTT